MAPTSIQRGDEAQEVESFTQGHRACKWQNLSATSHLLPHALSPCQLSGQSLTHVVAHEGDANGYGVPGRACVIALDVPASALIYKPIFSNQEAAWGSRLDEEEGLPSSIRPTPFLPQHVQFPVSPSSFSNLPQEQ